MLTSSSAGFVLLLASLGLPAVRVPESVTLSTTLTSRAMQPGEVIRVDVRSPVPLTSVRVRAFGDETPAWRGAPGLWQALVGIDLDVTPGQYVFGIEATTTAGTSVQADEAVTVIAKDFPTRELRVDPRFVNPPAAARVRIEKEAQRLGKLYARSTVPAWRQPFRLPIARSVISGFGVRSVFNGEPRAPHGGADFAAKTGTPVRAPNAGQVVLVAPLYYTGRTVVVDHGGGVISVFAHLSATRVKTGARVRRGQLVGLVGATGRVTGPHLHWTVRLHGARVDPLSLIVAIGGEDAAR